MKKLLSLLLVAAMGLSLVGCGGSDNGSKSESKSDLEYVKDKGTLVVGVTDFAPMDYKDESGNWIGFDADMASAFAESLGVKAEFVEIDWDNKIMELDGKTIDCVWNGMTIDDGVTSAMSCSNAYCNNQQVVVVPKDKAEQYATVEACKDLQFAVENGSAGLYRCLSGGSDKSGGFTGIFAPVPKFSVDAFALRENKKGEEVCGDSFTLKSIDNDRYLAAISDGAGSGKRAQAKSESALDLLEAFSDTGIKRNEMFKTMNRLLLSKCNPEEYSTMDVTELDLDSGMLYWTKIGAVPGYILRQGKVEKVQSDALPIGIVTRINPTTTKKLLQKDDIIVLVSDGIYDGLCKGNDDAISLMLPVLNSSDPKNIAEKIMKKARSSGNDDDMTVMVLKINAA